MKERGESRPCIIADMFSRAKANSTGSNELPDETEDMLKNVCATTAEGSLFSVRCSCIPAYMLMPVLSRRRRRHGEHVPNCSFASRILT